MPKKCPKCNHSLPHTRHDDDPTLSDYCEAPVPFGPVVMYCPCRYKEE